MWVHLLDSWDQALSHCAQVQSGAEAEAYASGHGDSANSSARGRTPTPRQERPDGVNPLLEIYTVLIEVCLNPLEPIALGIIPPKHQKTNGGEGKSSYYRNVNHFPC